jgi:hypothetical protein
MRGAQVALRNNLTEIVENIPEAMILLLWL